MHHRRVSTFADAPVVLKLRFSVAYGAFLAGGFEVEVVERCGNPKVLLGPHCPATNGTKPNTGAASARLFNLANSHGQRTREAKNEHGHPTFAA